MKEITDKELLNLIKQGNNVAFQNLYNKYWKKLFLYSFQILKDRQEAEDTVQEIFFSIWDKKSGLEINNVSSYLISAAKYKAISKFKTDRINKEEIEQFEDYLTYNQVEEFINFREVSDKINVLLNELPERCREIFYLSRIENLSNEEISQRLNISIQTVKNQITKALQMLRPKIQDLELLFLLIYFVY